MGNDLDLYPNLMTEIGAVFAELGRHPKELDIFFVQYRDRIFFGKDSFKVNEYHTYFRVLKKKIDTLIIIECVMPTGKYLV